MVGSLPFSVFPGTVPSMKKQSAMFKLYRELPIYEDLYSSMFKCWSLGSRGCCRWS